MRDVLASSVRAMKIPEVLDKVAVMFRKISGDLAQNSVRLESMQSELRCSKNHLKNAGFLLIGRAPKEAEQAKKDKGTLTRFSHLSLKTGKVFASLEQKAMDTADKLRVSRIKDSVKTELQNLKGIGGGKTMSEPSRDR